MAVIDTPIAPGRSLSRPTLRSELYVIYMVARREWRIMLRYPSWFISLIIWPVIFPAGYLLSGRALSGPDGSGLERFTQLTGIADFAGYIAIGTVVWMWQNMTLWNVGFALRNEQMRGTLESNWLSPAWRFSYLIGYSLTQFVMMAIFVVITFFDFTLFFGMRFNGNPLLVLLVFLASIPSIYGLAIAFASLVIAAREANAFVFLVRGLVMIFCGITFPVTLLPGWMQSVARWIPPTYSIHGIRAAALGNATLAELAPDLIALLLFGAFWMAAGYLLFRWLERRARRIGAISQY